MGRTDAENSAAGQTGTNDGDFFPMPHAKGSGVRDVPATKPAVPAPAVATAPVAEPATDRTPRRRVRRPVAGGDKLRAPEWAIEKCRRDGLVPRFVNDTENGTRIQELMERGYVLLEAPEGMTRMPATAPEHIATPLGRAVSRVVDKDKGIRAYLMGQPKEYYDEDQQAKQQSIDRTEASYTHPNKDEGQYGGVKLTGPSPGPGMVTTEVF
jgi:hypothetical protein